MTDSNQHLDPATVIDPVCGMTVNPDSAAASLDHQGKTYYFCSRHCMDKFRDDPERFLNKPSITPDQNFIPTSQIVSIVGQSQRQGRLPPAHAGGSDIYTCPMHPEIVRNGPGSCPICGMALEPRTVSLEETENPELVDMSRRFWVSVALTTPLLAIGMSEFIPGADLERIITMRSWGWLELGWQRRWCSGARGHSSCAVGNRLGPETEHVYAY